jgi:hypothetical protein
MVYMCLLVYSCFVKNPTTGSWLTTHLSRWGCYMYYLSYSNKSMKHWWVVYKVNPEMGTCRYNAYMERHDDDDDDDVIHVYQEENEGDQGLSFTVSYGARLTLLGTRDVELMEEEPGPSKKCLRK